VRVSRDRLLASCVVLAILVTGALGFSWAIGASQLYLRKLPLPAPRPLASMPAGSPSWWRAPPPMHEDVLESPEVVVTLGTENYLTRALRTKLGGGDREEHQITLHAAYYTGMIDTVPHVPERCFVGGGLQIGSASRTLPIELDLNSRTIRPAAALRGIVSPTPERHMPATDAAGSPAVYWALVQRQTESGTWTSDGWRRIPFDPSQLELRVQEFRSPDGGRFYSGYFFIANGGTTSTAEAVRQLAFKLEDKHAYYLKVQFTSSTAESHEQLAELASSYLQENLGKILTTIPDWIEVQLEEDAGEASASAGS